MKKIKFNLPIYSQFDITVIITEDVGKEATKLVKEEWSGLDGAFITKEIGSTDLYLLWDGKGLETLVHELFHLVAYVMRFVQIPLIEETEEAYCYLQGWLFNKIWKLKN